MIEFIYWLTLNCVVLIPLCLIVRHVRNPAFLPVVLYGLSLWVFLVIGLPFESIGLGRKMNFNLSYYLVIIAATIPIYAFAVMGMCRKIFPRCSFEIGFNDSVRMKASLIVFIVLWLIIIIGVAIYFVKVGRPPLFDSSIFDIFGPAKGLKTLRKSVTYTPEFKLYKRFFYDMPPLAALFGFYLYLKRRISFFPTLLSVIAAMILTVSFLHKQGPILIVVMIFMLWIMVKKTNFRHVIAASLLVTLLLLGIFVFYLGTNVSIIDLLTIIGKRIVCDYFFPLEFGLDSFPSKFPFFYGATLPNPAGLFSFEQVDLSGFTIWHLHGNTKGVGAAPMPGVGEFYVNFGPIGVLLFVCAISAWLFFLVTLFYYLRRNLFGICLWVFLSLDIINVNKQSFFILIDYKMFLFGLAIIGLYYVAIQFMRSFGRQCSSPKPVQT